MVQIPPVMTVHHNISLLPDQAERQGYYGKDNRRENNPMIGGNKNQFIIIQVNIAGLKKSKKRCPHGYPG